MEISGNIHLEYITCPREKQQVSVKKSRLSFKSSISCVCVPISAIRYLYCFKNHNTVLIFNELLIN